MKKENPPKPPAGDQHESPTFVREGAAPTTRMPDDFPVHDWDRYEFISYLGQGGMGRVYKARDVKLKRLVALKFIRGDDALLNERFLREAQAQAKIEHDNVCKIYEAGEVQGKLYIAMQFINGMGLNQAERKMTLEEKVKVIKDTAEGLHAAHRSGLIHRDIKPGNILVEQSESEGWHPYLLDFGLAREFQAEGLTVTGALVGTPAYMAPEQAWGEFRQLDRRADIYSLGATLYEMLSGHTPLGTQNTMEVLKKMLNDEPTSLHVHQASIPRDLETIVMKCLEREPQRRYDTARELAEDLQRFLDGDPIAARRSTISYRLIKRARKHKALFAVSSVALLAILFLIGLGIRQQILSKRRAALAQSFGQQVEQMDSLLRIGHEIPVHDTRLEKGMIESQIKGIQDRMKDLGAVAEGAGNYALGRGYLSLEKLDQAKESLEKAWQSGYREPQVAYSLGLVYGKFYQQELESIDSIRNAEIRETKRKEVEAKYRDPAVRYLRGSMGSPITDPAYVEGLIAFYERHFEDALEKAEQAFKNKPWLYETKLLQADIYRAQGNENKNKGEYSAADGDYARAEKAFEEGTRIGESDIRCYDGMASLQIDKMNMEVYGRGGSLDQHLQEFVSATDTALKIDPSNDMVYAHRAIAYRMYAEDQFNQGKDPTVMLHNSIHAAEEAIKINRKNAIAFGNMGTAQELQAENDMYSGKDPRAQFAIAIRNMNTAVSLNPKDSFTYNIICIAYNVLGQYMFQISEDPSESYRKAVEAGKKALEVDPRNLNAMTNLATAYSYLSETERESGRDPRKNMDLAIAQLENGLKMNPKSAYTLNNLGSVVRTKAEYEKEHGVDPRPNYKLSLEYLQRVTDVYPKDPLPYFNRRDIYKSLADLDRLDGKDPAPILEESRKNFQAGTGITSNMSAIFIDQVPEKIVQVRYDLSRNKNPQVAIAEAEALLDRAQKMEPRKASAFLRRGEIEIFSARWKIQNQRSPEQDLTKAEHALRTGIEINAKTAATWMRLAEVYRWRAVSTPGNTGTVATQGMEPIEKAIAMNPLLGEAFAIRSELQKLQGNLAAAKESMDKALQINPLLAHDYPQP